MIVYADLVFLVNFAFDMELLLILLKLTSKKAPPVRLFLSACIGGVQGVFVFIPYFRILAAPPAGLFVPLVMTVLVMYPSRLREYIKVWLLFLCCSFVLSGMMSFFGIDTLWGLLLLVPVYAAVSLIKKTSIKKNLHTALYYGENCVKVEGFMDSGNGMMYRGVPVILANEKIFEKLFGKGFNINAVYEWADSRDICVIPYQALGKTGVVTGVRLDKAVIDGKNYENVILGYFSDNLTDDLILNGIMV